MTHTDPQGEGGANCYLGRGEYYKGKTSVTVSGYACQKWAVQSPHSHHYQQLHLGLVASLFTSPHNNNSSYVFESSH